jgi:hypothetical protein
MRSPVMQCKRGCEVWNLREIYSRLCALGESDLQLLSFLISTPDEGGQLHASAALYLGIEPAVPIE